MKAPLRVPTRTRTATGAAAALTDLAALAALGLAADLGRGFLEAMVFPRSALQRVAKRAESQLPEPEPAAIFPAASALFLRMVSIATSSGIDTGTVQAV